jgi:predicted nucleotidyltransferase
MFRVKNTSSDFKKLNICVENEPLVLRLHGDATSDLIDEKFRKYFEENPVEWAAILPAAESKEVIIESLDKPVIKKPKGRPRKATK